MSLFPLFYLVFVIIYSGDMIIIAACHTMHIIYEYLNVTLKTEHSNIDLLKLMIDSKLQQCSKIWHVKQNPHLIVKSCKITFKH